MASRFVRSAPVERSWFMSGGPFLESPGTFRARKAIFSSSVASENREVYTPKTSCMKGTSVHIQNFEILLWLFGPEKFLGLSKNGPLARDCVVFLRETLLSHSLFSQGCINAYRAI